MGILPHNAKRAGTSRVQGSKFSRESASSIRSGIRTVILIGVTGVNTFWTGSIHAAEPTGLYFHQFTGSFDGTEWSTWGARPGVNRYEFSDVTSEGTYPGVIAEDHTLVLDQGRGTGAFTSDNEGFIDFTLSGGLHFHSEFHRAPHTDDRFPVFMREAIQGDQSLSGQWEARISYLDPSSGEVLTSVTQQMDVLVENDTVRLTEQGGTYYQGVWFGNDQAGFRVVENARRQRYQSFEGSETNLTRDLLGDLRILDANTMTAVFFEQTRASVGSQQQGMKLVELTRVPAPSASVILGTGMLAASRRRRGSR